MALPGRAALPGRPRPEPGRAEALCGRPGTRRLAEGGRAQASMV